MKTSHIFIATMTLIGATWAANSWADEQDYGSPHYDPNPVFQPPMISFHVNTPPIFGSKYFGNTPNYLFKPLPPVFTPPVQKLPPPMKDATLLCAATLCSAPATCRLVQSCPTCPPKAACLAPAAVPQNFDQCCQMHGYRQTVMLHHLLPATAIINPSKTTSLRCIPWLPSLTRGGCSPGAACVPYTQPGAPAGTGTCCAGPITTPAVPIVSPAAAPPTIPAAPAQRKSPFVAPAAASAPVMHRVDKAGTCPSVNYLMSTCTGISCTRDSDCGSYLKCCPSSCGGSTCTVPSLPPLPPPGPAQATNLQG
ncbi:endoplasmic reticulum aminopeptidase 2 [Elysia marginata]|uniref:Endoplasmic reticulum aminopeptidase 2 n=1 Tax=Elysia marginata TaxID=1093978 RepID=A0AAV4FLA3_9GAST|nr:endoplasmic reticulum aminopeptidase 2 [Elysia marginata]